MKNTFSNFNVITKWKSTIGINIHSLYKISHVSVIICGKHYKTLVLLCHTCLIRLVFSPRQNTPSSSFGSYILQKWALWGKVVFPPRDSTKPMVVHVWYEVTAPQPWFRTLEDPASSRAPCGLDRDLCCSCIMVQLLPLPILPFSLPHSYCSWEHSPYKLTACKPQSQSLFSWNST